MHDKSVMEFCTDHRIAYKSLTQHYETWCKAYDNLEWKDFLNKLLSMEETGIWVKDMIKIELKKI